MDLSHVNKAVGDNMRWIRQFEANPDEAFNVGNEQPQMPPVDESQYMMIMFYQMMMALMAQFFPTMPQSFPQDFSQNVDQQMGQTQSQQSEQVNSQAETTAPVLPNGVTIVEDAENQNIPENNAIVVIQDALNSENKDVRDAAFLEELKQGLVDETFTLSDLGRGIKQLMVEGSAQETEDIAFLLRNLIQHRVINPVPFIQDSFLEEMTDEGKQSFREALIEMGVQDSNDEAHRPFITFLLNVVDANQNEDSGQRQFVQDLLAGYQVFLKNNPDLPESQMIQHVLGLV